MDHSPLGLSRRQLVIRAGAAGLGLLTGCGRLPGAPERPARVPVVGVLTAATFWLDSFRQGSLVHCYMDGQNIVVDVRSSEGGETHLAEYALELVHRPVVVIVATGLPAIRAAI